MLSPLPVATAQITVTDDPRRNGPTIRAAIEEAANLGARLVVFSEGALSGYARAQHRSPEVWQTFRFDQHDHELDEIARTCAARKIHALVGGVQHQQGRPPLNSAFLVSDQGEISARYDKRYLSHSEVQGWFSPGRKPVVVEVDGWRFGILICIEVNFHELFAAYEEMGVHGMLYSSAELNSFFQTALLAHAGFTSCWIVVASPEVGGVIGPHGEWIRRGDGIVQGSLDPKDERFFIALNYARPWRQKARLGHIYR